MTLYPLDVPADLYEECGGLILKGDFSKELKKRLSYYIKTYNALEETGNPAILYISAWRDNEREIWYEYINNRFALLLRCKRSEAAMAFRNSIKDQIVYRYLDGQQQISKEIQHQDQLDRSRDTIRSQVNQKRMIDAVYKIAIANKQDIWLKDQAVVENYTLDKIHLSLGCLTIVTKEMKAEEERIQRERLQVTLQMAGAVCHELNQPLQGIYGYSETLLMQYPENDPASYKVRKIIELTSRMGKITKKLMRITKYEIKDYLQGIKIIDIDKSSKPTND